MDEIDIPFDSIEDLRKPKIMNTAQGVVAKVINKNGFNYLTLEGEEGLYSTYKTVPSCNPGDSVEFTFQQKGQYKNADAKSIRVTGTGQGTGQASPATSTGSTGSTWVPDKSRQLSIELQSARSCAVNLVTLMVEQGAAKMPAKQADKYDAIMGLTEHVTKELYSWTESPKDFLNNPTADSEE